MINVSVRRLRRMAAAVLLLFPAWAAMAQDNGQEAVWGPYLQWAGKTFVRQDDSDATWGAYRISYEWKEPGKVLQETGYYKDGKLWFTVIITPGQKPRELTADSKPGPKAKWQLVDVRTLASSSLFGYQTVRRATGPSGYEEQTVKRGSVQQQRSYVDEASAEYQAYLAAQKEREAEKDAQGLAALRAAGVPDEATVPVPDDRVLAYQEPVRGPAGALRVTRGRAWEMGGCYLAIYINDRLAARMDPGETAMFKVPAGEVRLGVGNDPGARGTCRIGQSSQDMHVTPLAKGEHLHVHFRMSGGARFSEALLNPDAG